MKMGGANRDFFKLSPLGQVAWTVYALETAVYQLDPAEEFAALARAATAHIFYHRTYCNHVNAWIMRAVLEELAGIVYGAALPEELAAGMAEIIRAAGGGADV